MEIQRAVVDPFPDDEGLDLIEDLLLEDPESTEAGSDTGVGEPRWLVQPVPIGVPS